ncbi:hypothetical protein KZ810_13170 [Sphingomonas sp. RHCKR47]|uniref:hypothetical protein n=1 Tax=Sphingomonas citricola TaxID=2862498 RepID=UPI001CA5AC37|nr:hypothetical protein [Sphingomonas citricola]MBW6524453.1 hypothetical protein [Sphingomonas citricola]
MATALQADWLSQPEEDPRIAAAVADFRGAVIDIRRLSAELFTTGEGTTKRSVLQAHIDDLVGGMQARADMVGLTLDQLFALINAELKRKRVGNDHQPHGDHLRAITDENTSAYADEARLHREIDRLQKMVPAAIDRRIAADRACAGYCAGWAVRGSARA